MSGVGRDQIVSTPEAGVYYVNGQTWAVRFSSAVGATGARRAILRTREFRREERKGGGGVPLARARPSRPQTHVPPRAAAAAATERFTTPDLVVLWIARAPRPLP
jgi:hypothetical protein